MLQSPENGVQRCLRPCLGCGEPVSGSRCQDCSERHRAERPFPSGKRLSKATASERGYDSNWQRLSKRARQLQPWCSDCGTDSDLTGDHLRWTARSLEDVDVVCRSCNSARGPLAGRGLHTYV
jgi:5-methylcytosine-specific restriction endonuclease McrA